MRFMDVTLTSGKRVIIVGFEFTTLIGLIFVGFLCFFIMISAYFINKCIKKNSLRKEKKKFLKKLEEEQGIEENTKMEEKEKMEKLDRV